MSIIRLPLRFEGSKGEKVLYALFDSGINYNCINDKLQKENFIALEYLVPKKLRSKILNHYVEIKNGATLNFYLNHFLLSDEFLVVPQLSEEVIIGAATMQKWRMKLDFDTDTVIVDSKVAKLQLI